MKSSIRNNICKTVDINIINNLLNYELRTNKIIRPSSENINLKILIPCVAAGAIIGKGGEAIAIIQKETGAKVKISKSYDFYPGTTERICLIMGTIDSVIKVHDYIIDRIQEKPDQLSKQVIDGKGILERHKQVKILVPNSTAGMIIGKSGCYIKEIKEKTGSFVQISQKSKEINLPERCVTIAGDRDQNRNAVQMILGKIAEDPHSSSCPTISYVDIIGPVASAYPTGSPYAMIGGNFSSTSSGSISNLPSINSPSNICGNGNSLALSPALSALNIVSSTSSSSGNSMPINNGCPSPPASHSASCTSLLQHCSSSSPNIPSVTTSTNSSTSLLHNITTNDHSMMTPLSNAAFLSCSSTSSGSNTYTTSLMTYTPTTQVDNNSIGKLLQKEETSPIPPPLQQSQTQQHQQQQITNDTPLSFASIDNSAPPAPASEFIRNILKISGFSHKAVDDLTNAIEILCKYGLINNPTSTTSNTSPASISPPQQPTIASSTSTTNIINNNTITPQSNSQGLALSNPIIGQTSSPPNSNINAKSTSLASTGSCGLPLPSTIVLYDCLPLYGSSNDDNHNGYPLDFLINSYLTHHSHGSRVYSHADGGKSMDLMYSADSMTSKHHQSNMLMDRSVELIQQQFHRLDYGNPEGMAADICRQTNTCIEIDCDKIRMNDLNNVVTLKIYGGRLDDILDAIGLIIYAPEDDLRCTLMDSSPLDATSNIDQHSSATSLHDTSLVPASSPVIKSNFKWLGTFGNSTLVI